MEFGRSPHRSSHPRTKIRCTPGRLLATTKEGPRVRLRKEIETRIQKLSRERESHGKRQKKRKTKETAYIEVHMNHVQTNYAVRFRLMHRMQTQESD